MKIALAVLSLLALGACELDAATEVPPLAITSPEKTSMKDDLGKENPKWKFVAGQWTRRPSGGRQVLATGVRPGNESGRGAKVLESSFLVSPPDPLPDRPV
jgi:hypothetical protein